MDRYVIELGKGFSSSIRKYLARASGTKPCQISQKDIVSEFLIPVLTQAQDNLRTVANSDGDWAIQVYRVKKVRDGYRQA